ncbi:hypothetical protein DL93DRAFT_540722 [Clavulina sp. PMI_390]|nr:hypothetical protein DL93DRAFT_540722 [Clavulina sp. PMI_390]
MVYTWLFRKYSLPLEHINRRPRHHHPSHCITSALFASSYSPPVVYHLYPPHAHLVLVHHLLLFLPCLHCIVAFILFPTRRVSFVPSPCPSRPRPSPASFPPMPSLHRRRTSYSYSLHSSPHLIISIPPLPLPRRTNIYPLLCTNTHSRSRPLSSTTD